MATGSDSRPALSLPGLAARPPGKSRRGFDLLLFSKELRTLLHAGLTVVEAIEALAEQAENGIHHEVYSAVQARLREGQPLSRALEAQPDCFPLLFVAGVRANETSGGLLQALERYIAYAEQLNTLKRKVVSAALYPAILLGVGLAVAAFLLLFLVPRFSTIYADSQASLPLLSRLLMKWGLLMHAHPLEMTLLLFGVAGALAFGLSRRRMRLLLWQQLQQVRFIHNLVRHFFLARLYRTLAMLLHAGIPAVSALAMARGLLSTDMAEGLDHAIREVREGQSLSSALDRHQLTTPITLRLLRVGERSGELADMCDHIAGFMDETISRWVETLSKIVEPALMLLIGGFIGLIVILMYLPIFELASGVGA